MIDERFMTALHVETLRQSELHADHEPHVLFQSSTIGALLAGAYDGDVSFGELAEHGDLGLGTLNGLDGEMIAVDGHFYRADIDGQINEVAAESRTPFAVVVPFSTGIGFSIDSPLAHQDLVGELDRHLPPGTAACAIRIDGEFEFVQARSVPRQNPPYRPLTEVVEEQHVFEFHNLAGTVVGFRFPEYSGGVEVSGYHLHFITDDRARGGHLLDCRTRSVEVKLDPSTDLHVELPPGIDLSEPHLDGGLDQALKQVER